jgi:hypothetical protein
VIVIYDVVLRPGRGDEIRARGLMGGDAIDEWLGSNGTPGDRFKYTSHLPDGRRTASGEGVIDDLGEAAYKLA